MKNQPLPETPKISIELGDCVEAMQRLDTASVDLVVTSPPYNLGIHYKTFQDTASRCEYLKWCEVWASEIRRLLKPGGSFFLNVGGSPSNPLLPLELAGLLTSGFFRLQNTIHWIKAITIETEEGDYLSRGHFKPISSRRFLNDCHEYIFHFTLDGSIQIDRLAVGVPYADKSNISRWGHTGGRDRRCRGNTWFIPYKTIRDRASERPHPATFPVELAENCIRLQGNAKQLVMLDPFLGTGSSAVAAIRQGVMAFRGIDIDPFYVDYARRRVQAFEYEVRPNLRRTTASGVRAAS